MQTGSRVGRYEIRGKIGSGGMGEVYRAFDTELGREAALKVLSLELAGDEDRIRRFVLEAKAASALNHPNILTVYEIGQIGELRYIAAELVNGATLRDRMRLGDLNLDDGLSIALQTAAALCAAHEAGIIHRDIKPENLMVRDDGLVKVLDFGLAKLTEKRSESADEDAATATLNTAPGVVLGTISYMSPEQARGKELDARSDIFSFGIVLYEMFTGKRPFAGDGQLDIISSILKDEPAPVRQIAADLPRQLERIVGKTLRKDRGTRYQSVKDLQIDLEDLREELKFEARSTRDVEPTVLARIQTTDAQFTKPTLTESISATRRFTLLHAILFGAAAIALAAGIWFLRPIWMPRPFDPTALKVSQVASWNSAPGELFSNARFSPDGKMIAFSSTRSGSKNLWVKQTTAAEAIQVTNDKFSNQDPIWSPAGDELAFFSQKRSSADSRANSTGIWRVTALGGTPRAVGPVADGSAELRRWTASGKVYYQSDGALYAMDVASGAAVKVSSFDPSAGRVTWTNISPDEKTIASVIENEGRWKLFTEGHNSSKRDLVAEGDGSVAGVAWLPEKGRFFYSAMSDGIYQIFVADAAGRPQRMTSAESDNVVVDAEPAGNSVIFSSAKEESNIWRIPAAGGQDGPVSRGINPVLWPAASADGRRIVYQSAKNLNRGSNLFHSTIMVKDVGAGEDKATQLAANGFLPTWSPDASAVAFLRQGMSTFELLTANPNGGGEKVAASGGIPAVGYSVSPYNQIQAAAFGWSPDSSRIAYVSDRSGASNIWAVSPRDGTDVQLTDNTDPDLVHYCPIWSADGAAIAYYVQANSPATDGRSFRSLNIVYPAEKRSVTVLQPAKITRLLGWSAAGDGLIIAETEKSGSLPAETILKTISIKNGPQNTIEILKNAYYYNIVLSPDRRTIAFAGRNDEMDDVWTVPAAGGEARKLTANNDTDLYFSKLTWSGDGTSVFFGKQTRFSLLTLISGLN